HEYRVFWGESPPSQAGDIYIGYGLISDQAVQENRRRAAARTTMLPKVLEGLQLQREYAQRFPEQAQQALAASCQHALQPSTGDAAWFGATGQANASNQQMLAEMCASSGHASLRLLCERAQSKQSSAGALAQRAQAQAVQRNQDHARQRREDLEMQQICASSDVLRYYDRLRRQAELSALDMETMGRLAFWEIRAAYEDGQGKAACWVTLRWPGLSQAR
ncbi:MAG: hypothetical protein N2690_04850, partial [Rhodocyclaceae bacterium]|nr:hypothetical protein [Rhodocyclaceae bacterium]